MRRIVLYDWLTADGYFAAADGTLDWVVPDDEQSRAAADGMPGYDTFLFGRRTYELFEAFWSRALDDSATAPDPHRPGQRTGEHRAIAIALEQGVKLVFSRTLRTTTWKNSRVVPELERGEIESMKRQPGKDMLVFGSGSIATQLTDHGLIDEYQLVVCPVFIGRGRRLLDGISGKTKLALVASTPYPSGDVLLRYTPRA